MEPRKKHRRDPYFVWMRYAGNGKYGPTYYCIDCAGLLPDPRIGVGPTTCIPNPARVAVIRDQMEKAAAIASNERAIDQERVRTNGVLVRLTIDPSVPEEARLKITAEFKRLMKQYGRLTSDISVQS